MKKKEEVISVLKEKRSDLIRKYHITRIGIFGPVIRDEAGPGSDIDVLVDFSDEASLLDHVGLKIYLEKISTNRSMSFLNVQSGQNSGLLFSQMLCISEKPPVFTSRRSPMPAPG